MAGCEAEADVGGCYDAGLAGEVERFGQLGGTDEELAAEKADVGAHFWGYAGMDWLEFRSFGNGGEIVFMSSSLT
jgi:hypothetical protein